MAHVTNAATTATQAVGRSHLVIGGRVTDAGGAPAAVRLQLTVALEAVVTDGAVSGDDHAATLHDAYGVELWTDADGRFTDSYDFSHEVRPLLTGWVMCTVQVEVAGAPVRAKVVRWMRPTSDEVIDGLSALLADVPIRS